MSTSGTKRGGPSAGWIGSLAHTPLGSVLRRIALEERSGDLQVTTPDAIKTVYFDRGFVVFASSNLKRDRLGESLVEAGRISRRELALAGMLMKSRKETFGRALVSAGILSEEELGREVAAQVNRVVLSLFSAKKGVYSFDERPCSIPVEHMVSLSVYRIAIEGARRMSSKRLVLAGLPPLDTPVRVVDVPPFTLDVERLRPVEKQVLRAAGSGSGTPLQEIVRGVAGDEGVVLRACFGLLSGGVLEGDAPDDRGQGARVQEETGTFVLSEIRRKVAPREPGTPVAASPPRQVVDPGASGTRRGAGRSSAPEPAEPAAGLWSRAWRWLVELCSRLLTLLRDRPASEPEPVRLSPAPTEATSRPVDAESPPAPPAELASPRAPEPPDAPVVESLGVPSWSMADDPDEPAAETVGDDGGDVSLGVPSWSMMDDPNDAPPEDDPQTLIESLGVPSWSMKDDPDEATRVVSPTLHEPEAEVPAEPARDGMGEGDEDGVAAFAPSWSLLDPPEPAREAPEEPELRVELETEPETPLVADPLEALDTELFIEPDDASDSQASLMTAIPAEKAEVEVESAAESRSQPAPPEPGLPIEPAAEPPPPSRGARRPASAPGPSTEPSSVRDFEPPDADARERAMRRLRHGGGEARLFRDVKLHFKLHDWEGAVGLLEQLVEISPGSALYHGLLARAMSRHPRLRKEAEGAFVEAIRLAPQNPQLHYWLGAYYESFGLRSRAITEFRTALRIDPGHRAARKRLGGGRHEKDEALGSVIKKIFG